MDRYEQLRRERTKRTMSREMAIFLAEGMCAWIHSWSFLSIKTRGEFEDLSVSIKEETYFSPPGTGSLTGFRFEMVNILAAMSLKQLMGDRI